MTNADVIRSMSDDELVDLLVWGTTCSCGNVPTCDNGCKDFDCGCAGDCPHEKQERAVREWLEAE